jgi:hypothetical protein
VRQATCRLFRFANALYFFSECIRIEIQLGVMNPKFNLLPEEFHGEVIRTAEGGWRVAETRVSLDSIVYAYKNGR